MQRQTAIAVGVAVLLVIAGCSATTGQSPAASTGESAANESSTIRVAGSGSADAEPNQAVVRVAAVAIGPDAATARERLAENTSRMRTALEDIGVDDDQITTVRYDIYQDRRPPREDGEEPPVRYRASHDFEITVSNPDRAGAIVDTAVQNGATEVNDVSFRLSTDRRRQLEDRARRAAMADARSKARGLAGAANLTVTGVRVIQTSDSGAPRPADERYATETATPMSTGAPDSDFESGSVTVTTRVQVVYEAEPTNETASA
ncbi:SIMPL domain-containing protein [Haloplanus sp. C73]|uniref:SIMPL domain-containing protein n=1 Tax=Haloplanus sp. C73 TaxID=3421641 RepID=UPI003EC0BCFA